MNIYILTLGRPNNQVTWSNLPKSLQDKVTFVVQHHEKDLHPGKRMLVLPEWIKRVHDTRHYVLYNGPHTSDKLVMLDDDLRFFKRNPEDKTKFIKSSDNDTEELFAEIEKALDKYVHVGVLAREGGNRITTPVKETTRMARVLAYNIPKVTSLGVRFDRFVVQQDFDMTLQLLYRGYPNLVICDWVQDQGGSNAKGGCSTYRTPEMMAEHVKVFSETHKGIVKIVEKETKTGWFGEPRKDVIIQWKKALNYANNI